ncbi:hypothetical protein HN388_01860 [bacterium]|jgi:hypothetical protein|nr:hypothetical protein [bacterium]
MKKFLAISILMSVCLSGLAHAVEDPDINSIMFCPTPQTLPAGSSYFRDVELFFLNYGYSVSDDTNISIGTHFPITGELSFVSAGFKHRIFDRDEYRFGLALFANGTFYDDGSFGVVGLIAGNGNNDRSLNLSLSQGYNEHSSSGIIVMFGGDTRIGDKSKFIAEYFNTAAFMDFNDDFYGFMNIGVKWFGEDMAVSLTALTPMQDDTFFSLPMITVSKHW